MDGHGVGDQVTLAVRPERIGLSRTHGSTAHSAVIREATYLGTDTAYEISAGGGITLTVRDQNAEAGMGRFAAGDQVQLSFSAGAARMWVG